MSTPDYIKPLVNDVSQTADDAMLTRRSVRGYTTQAVAPELLTELLDVAARAPSGTNTQPWQVYVVTGAAKKRLCDSVTAAFLAPDQTPYKEEYSYYPEKWKSPFIDRRRKVGWDLYGMLGLTKDNKAGMQAQHAKNYQFFDAPVGLIFTLDKDMGVGSILDYGMFLQNVMLAARARGLHTCPQAAWNAYHTLIRQELGIAENQTIVCGMALGYADSSVKENDLYTHREGAASFTHFLDN